MTTLRGDRRIRSGQSLALADLLQSIFVLEAMAPSQPLWIASPWISDLALIDNSGRQFSALGPSLPPRGIRLTELLELQLQKGGSVRIVTSSAASNRTFIRATERLASAYSQLNVVIAENIHEKGITGERFTLDGSMNLTFNGVHVNEEYVIYSTDPKVVAERRLTFFSRWEQGAES